MKYDAVVIGAGTGGYPAAIRLGQLGKKVAVIEKEAVGGVCLNWGCIPTKALCHAAEVRHQLSGLSRMGFEIKEKLDFSKLQSWKDSVVTKLVKGVEFLFEANGVELIRGTARIVQPGKVEVAEGSGGETLDTDAIIIATGSTPLALPGIEPDDERIYFAERALFFAEVPQSMLVVGAGASGLEMATIYNALGTEVTLVEMMDQVSPDLDREIAENLARLLKKQGMELFLSSKVADIKKAEEGLQIKIEPKEGEAVTRQVSRALLAVGRRPVTQGLWADSISIETDDKGFIKVDKKLGTSVEGIYAAGDVTGPPLLAHRATQQGLVAAEVIAGHANFFDPKAMPSCIYTIPTVASVGMSQEEAEHLDREVEIGRFPYSASGRAATLGEREGLVKILAEKGSGKLLGMHVLGIGADIMIGEGILGMEFAAGVDALARAVHPHPTLLEPVMEAAENVRKRAIHIKN